jgi:hypothetical protein
VQIVIDFTHNLHNTPKLCVGALKHDSEFLFMIGELIAFAQKYITKIAILYRKISESGQLDTDNLKARKLKDLEISVLVHLFHL